MYFRGLFELSLLVRQLAAAFDLPHECSDGIMTTPTYGTTRAVSTVCANDTIDGPPSLIYKVLIDFPKYGEWNSFVYAVDLPGNVTSAKNVYVGSKYILFYLHSHSPEHAFALYIKTL
jgi:hypothetical protein